MLKTVSKYFALWFFLGGVVLIVFIQFVSAKNNERLVHGNQRLLKELKIQNDIRKLESDVLTVESDIRGAVITNDNIFLEGIRPKIDSIKSKLNALDHQLTDTLTGSDIALLNSLIREKISFSEQILAAYYIQGTAGGEEVVNTNRGKYLRDSIINIVNRMDSVRQAHSQQIIGSIENTGSNAKLWGTLLAIVACIACILAFLYVINKGRQQQRTIVLLNETEKKVREAAHLKEEFLANMSHEIRTPMNAILGFTDLLKKTDLSPHQRQYVEYIYSSGENLLLLINDILDLSKIEAGMMDLEQEPFSLNGLLGSVEIMFREKAVAKGLDFKISVDPKIHDSLCGDAVRLTQVLINLLSNSIKFTSNGFVHLHVSLQERNDDHVKIEFVVKDSGVGIAPEKRQRIFNRFQQAETQTTRHFGGTGLGLSIVKQLVDLQKGTIDLTSESGKGSEFTVVLPYTLVHLPIDKHKTPLQEATSNLGDIKILVAEDNQMNQHLIKHLMKQWQIDYFLVNNGKEVIEILKQSSFSIVLMDIQMPEMDGYEATLAIRNELKLEIPIIAMTAHAMPGEKERCLSFGMNDYISKPVREFDLYQILQQYSNAPKMENNERDGIIDLSYLKDISMGDQEFEQMIIQQFMIQVPQELNQMKKAINSLDFDQIKSVAHGMKSSVSYMGLNDRLHPILHRMENEAMTKVHAPHFEEDFLEVQRVCNIAILEAKTLLNVTV
jgi:signal transduction histidine kinase/CheY-like chemotaxis protein/HPt (histidine-containing phosphotransfer) domain-containing protein